MSDAEKYQRDAQVLRTSLHGVLEAAPDAIVLVDPFGRIALVNTQAERLFGYVHDALIGQMVELLIPSRFAHAHRGHRIDYFMDPRQRTMGSGLGLAGLRRDGTVFPVEVSLGPIEIEGNTFVMAAIRDVTTRKRSEEKFRGLLEAAPDAMVIVGRDGRIALINTQTERLFGYSREELLGMPVEQLVPGAVRERHVHHRVEYLGDPHRRMMGTGLRLAGRRRDGTEFPVEISLSPFETEEGTLVTAAVRDISSRIEVEAALQAANHDLEGFTYSVSHDLRAPIRQIDGFSKILGEELGSEAPERARHYLTRIQQGAEHMGRLVDDLLSLARIGRQDMRPRAVALSTIVDDAMSELEQELLGRSITWSVGDLPTAECDPGLMKSVFVNLLSNAVKYSRRRSDAAISVGAVTLDGRRVIFVRDNGVGFDMRFADKLFGVFQRLHRAEDFEGTGVGLATVQRIVRKHGGEIWAEAMPGEGATFYFSLAGLNSTIEA